MPPPAASPLWRVVGASTAGKRHVARREPSQDAFRYAILEGRWFLGVVADGAGSAAWGEAGANIAAASALKSLTEAAAGSGAGEGPDAVLASLRRALESARGALEAEARDRQTPLNTLATTLLVCIAGPAGAAAVQVGDGAVVLATAGGELRTLTKPAAGEYLNETLFLTSDRAMERAQAESWQGRVEHVALFSDGLQMLALKLPDAVPHAPFFRPLFGWLGGLADVAAANRDLEDWLRSPRVADRTDDDLTLLVAKRLE